MDYTVQDLEEALRTVQLNGVPLPEAFRDPAAHHMLPYEPSDPKNGRGARRMTPREVELSWPQMDVNQRIALAAVVLGDANASGDRLVVRAYRDICQYGEIRTRDMAAEKRASD